jgi:dTDP-glucose 4,6-dehydratase
MGKLTRGEHDWRCAVDIASIRNELGWSPLESLDSGLAKPIAWYLGRQDAPENSSSRAKAKRSSVWDLS